MRDLLRITSATLTLTGMLLAATGEGPSLLDAVKGGSLPDVQKALQQHANPAQPETDGTTPLHRAVAEDRADIVKALIAAGANVNAKNHYGVTPLVIALSNGNGATASLLLKAGANPRVTVSPKRERR